MTRELRFESLESRRLLASDWQHPFRLRDVSDDGAVTPLDALVGINRLNTIGATKLPLREVGSREPYYDVNGDGFHSPIDVLIVITGLNSGPLVDARLANDTGTGPNANSDLLTNDFSVLGSIRGHADVLSAKIAGRDKLFDLSDAIRPDGSFQASASKLEELFGESLADGDYSLLLSARGRNQLESDADRVAVKFTLDRTGPQATFFNDIVMQRSDQIFVPLNERVDVHSLDLARVKLFDASWDGFEVFIVGRQELQPVSVSLSENGRSLVIVPPPNARPIKYDIEIPGAVGQDSAGNAIRGEYPLYPLLARAHYFPPSAQEINFGATIEKPYQTGRSITDYRFELQQPDTILWTGDQVDSFNGYEWYDEFGRLFRSMKTGTGTDCTGERCVRVPGEAQLPSLIELPAGRYRLRNIDPIGMSSRFRVYRASDLPPLPTDRSSGNSDVWLLDAYQEQLRAGDRVFIERIDELSQSVIQAVLGPHGDRLPIQKSNGIQYFDAPATGNYVVMLNRVGFRIIRTNEISRAVAMGELVSGSISRLGPRLRFEFSTVPGEQYLIDVEKMGWSLTSKFQFVQFDGRPLETNQSVFIAGSRSGFVELELNALEQQGTDFRFTICRVSNLPLGVEMEAPGPGEKICLTIPSNAPDRLLLEGNHRFSIYDVEYSRQVQPRVSNAGSTSFAGMSQRYVLIVQGGMNGGLWKAMAPEVMVAPLQVGQETSVSFESGIERYEFVFDARAGELLSFEITNPLSNYVREFSIELLGADVAAMSFPSDKLPQVWRIASTGQYRLTLSTRDGFSPVRDLSFVVRSSLTWETLAHRAIAEIAPKRATVFWIPKGTENLVLSASMGSYLGEVELFSLRKGWVFLSYSSGPIPNRSHVDTLLDADDTHFLLVSNYSQELPLVFQRIEPSNLRKDVQIGESVSGQFRGLGDSAQLSMDLVQGQRIVVESQLGANIAFNGSHRSFDPSNPWIVPTTDRYTFTLKNRVDQPGEYSLTFLEKSANVLGRGLDGFEVVREGIIEPRSNEPTFVEYKFSAQAGTLFLLDWLDDFYHSYQIFDSAGRLLIGEVSNRESNVLNLAQGGEYTLRILNLFASPHVFKFILRDASRVPLMGLNETSTQDVEVPPYETWLWRIDLPVAKHLMPVRLSGYLGLDFSPASPCGNIQRLFGNGTCIALLHNYSDAPQPSKFFIQDLSTGPRIELDKPTEVRVSPYESTSFVFSTTKDNVQIVAILPDQVFARYYDLDGRRVDSVTKAGTYRMELYADIYLDFEFVLREVKPPNLTPYSLGTTAVGKIERAGDMVEFAVTVDNDVNLLVAIQDSLTQSQWARVYLIKEDQSAPTLELPRLDWGFTRFAAGRYRIRLVSMIENANFTFQLLDLSAASEIGLGSFEESRGPNDGIRVFRLAQGNTVSIIEQLADNTAKLVVFESSALHNELIRLPIYFEVENRPKLLSAYSTHYLIAAGNTQKIHFKLSLPEQLPVELPLGSVIEKQIRSTNGEELLQFTLDRATAIGIEFTAEATTATLTTPTGQIIRLKTNSLTWLEAKNVGQYNLHIVGKELFANYRVRLLAQDQLPEVIVAQPNSISIGESYRLQLPSDGSYAFEFRDPNDKPVVPKFVIVDKSGKEVLGAGRVDLNAGPHVVRLDSTQPATNQLSMHVIHVRQSSQVALLNATTDIQLGSDGIEERILKIPIGAGQLIGLETVDIAPQTRVDFRFSSKSTSNPNIESWTVLSEFSGLQRVSRSGILEMRFFGTGSSIVRLAELASSPVIGIGSRVASTLAGSQRIISWQLPDAANVGYVFEQLRSSKNVQWSLVDRHGTVFTNPKLGSQVAIVNQQPMFLVGLRGTGSTDAIDMEILLLVLDRLN